MVSIAFKKLKVVRDSLVNITLRGNEGMYFQTRGSWILKTTKRIKLRFIVKISIKKRIRKLIENKKQRFDVNDWR